MDMYLLSKVHQRWLWLPPPHKNAWGTTPAYFSRSLQKACVFAVCSKMLKNNGTVESNLTKLIITGYLQYSLYREWWKEQKALKT